MAAAHERFLGRCIGRLAEALIDFPVCPPIARPSTSAAERVASRWR
jgi:hypothetical protein